MLERLCGRLRRPDIERGGAGAAQSLTDRIELSHWDQPANAKILRCPIFAVNTFNPRSG